jgi:hypothetical protein
MDRICQTAPLNVRKAQQKNDAGEGLIDQLCTMTRKLDFIVNKENHVITKHIVTKLSSLLI